MVDSCCMKMQSSDHAEKKTSLQCSRVIKVVRTVELQWLEH